METFLIFLVLFLSESHHAAHDDLKLLGSSDLSDSTFVCWETGTTQVIQFEQ